MLRLTNISKVYKAANNDVRALDDVSLNFRKSEFVSILGPSGSGKTTLLNIVGGLDKYTTGDLIIAGKSTKDFKDRDWDFYRNERIGFIFQSYNLIPHQNVLSNVELALTISGIKKEERIRRAKEALDKVGLTDQYYKKPNQLSGGQCQRVAIARALVNNPEILLADEPTGALDTKTSEQIMDLIKEISKDRLVIMVTHNPDLAERFSSRIIKLLDGRIVEDSHPLADKDEIKEVNSLNEETINKSSKAKMGLFTSFFLSFKNLLSKRGRTILVSIASSIGIIGVSSVLAVSFGVTNYVTSMQDDMLSSYPVKISEKAIDLTALISGLASQAPSEAKDFRINDKVGMDSFIEYLMDKYRDLTNLKTNDINQDVLDYIALLSSDDVATTQYSYGIDVTNNIFTHWTASKELEHENQIWISTNGLTQRYIRELETVDGFTEYAKYVNLFTNFMDEMPNEKSYVLNQYDQLGDSNFSLDATDLTLVVDKENTLTDVLLAQMGIYPHDDFIHIGQKAVEIYKKGTKGETPEEDTRGLKQKYLEGDLTPKEYEEALEQLSRDFPYKREFTYEELVGREFYYVPHNVLWQYNEHISDETKMEGSFVFYDLNHKLYSLNYLSTYVDYGFDLLKGVEIDLTTGTSKDIYFVRSASSSRDVHTFFDAPVKVGLDNSGWLELDVPAGKSLIEVFIEASSGTIEDYLNILTGRGLGIDSANSTEKIFTFSKTIPDIFLPPTVIETYNNPIPEATETDTVKGYSYQAEASDEVLNSPGVVKLKISAVLRPKDSTSFGCLSRGVYYTKAFADLYMQDAAKEDNSIITDETNGFKAFFKTGKAVTSEYKAYCTFSYIDSTKMDQQVMKDDGYANALNSDLLDSISSLFSSAFGGLNTIETNQAYMRALTGLKTTYDSKTYKADYKHLPKEISIYPRNFNSKNNVTRHLDEWNTDKPIHIGERVIAREDRTDIAYTDTVAMIINVINLLITIITSALVAFTSLSLVVSCFMIAVITYISVMERVKEIGVIRSLGGRKKDVSRLFTAENFMTGLASGVIGVVVTYILSAIINVIVHIFGAPRIAALPWWMAILMVLLAIGLNVLSGFIPSRRAAKQDPVNALRSE